MRTFSICAGMLFTVLVSVVSQTQANDDEAQMVILEARVNNINKGEVFILLDEKSHSVVWIKKGDFDKFGIQKMLPDSKQVDGETYWRLADSRDIAVTVDMKSLVLSLKADPSLLQKQTISFSAQRALPPAEPLASVHGYSNYDISAQLMNSDLYNVKLGLRTNYAINNWVFVSDQTIDNRHRETKLNRPGSMVFRDFNDDMLRVSIGDVMPKAGMFSRSRMIGGVSLFRKFETRPDFVVSPTFQYQSSVDTPSTASVFVDGAKIRSVKLNPGQFEFNDLYYYTGLHNVEIEIQDSFGQKTNVHVPFYFFGDTLRRGLADYGVTLGTIRRYRYASDTYSGAAVSGYYRYGITDALTAGVNSEIYDNYYSLSNEMRLHLHKYGIVNVAMAARGDMSRESSGFGLSLNYSQNVDRASFSTNLLAQTTNFDSFGSEGWVRLSPTALQWQASSSLGYMFNARNAISLAVSHSEYVGGFAGDRLSTRFTRRLIKQMTVSALIAGSRVGGDDNYELTASIDIPLDSRWSGKSTIQNSNDGTGVESVISHAARNNTDIGGQVGMRSMGSINTLDATLHANSRFGVARVYSLMRNQPDGISQSAQDFNFSGSIATLGGDFFETPPIADAFAVVNVEHLPNVRIYNNNQYVGTTDAKGNVVISNLSGHSYNQVRVDHHDIPFDYKIDAVEKPISTSSAQGNIVTFKASKIAAITGIMVGTTATGKVILGSSEITLSGDKAQFSAATSPDGEFYIENSVPGTYRLSIVHVDFNCVGSLIVSDSQQSLFDFGEVSSDCESNR